MADLGHLQQKLLSAIEAHQSGQADVEGRTLLDSLVVEVRNLGAQKQDWCRAVALLVSSDDARSKGVDWWRLLEFFVVTSSLGSAELADALQEAVVRENRPQAGVRATLYGLLAFCGVPATAKTLAEDRELRAEWPLGWLDLMGQTTIDATLLQGPISAMMSSGSLTVEDFARRLVLIQRVGGTRLGEWLSELRRHVPMSSRKDFDEVIAEEFEPALNEAGHSSLSILPGAKRFRYTQDVRQSESIDDFAADSSTKRMVGMLVVAKERSAKERVVVG